MPALLDRFLPLTCELDLRPHPAQGQIRIVPLGADRVAVFHSVPEAAQDRRGPLQVRVGGGTLAGPFAATTLDLAAGRRRQVVLLGIGAETLLRDGITLAQGGETIARLAPEALQSPLAGPPALIAGLSETGAARLHRLLLTTGASLFGAGAHPDFHALADQLLAILPVTDLDPISLRAVGRRGCLVTCRAPDGPGLPADFVLLDGTRVQPQRRVRALAGSGPERLDLFLPQRPAREATLLALGPHPWRLAIPSAGQQALALAGWFRRASPRQREELLALLDGLSEGDAVARAQAAELRCPRDALPRLTLKAAALTGSGLLCALAVRDPHRLLSGVRVSVGTGGARRVFRLRQPVLHPDWGPVHLCHVGLGAAAGGSTLRLDAVTTARRIVPQGRSEVAAFDGTLPEGLAGFAAGTAVEAAAAALRDFCAHRPALTVTFFDFGRIPATPRLRILLPFDGSPDLLCAAATALAVEPRPEGIEAVVLPGRATRAERLGPLLEDLHAVTGIPLRLALADRPCHEAELLRAVLAEAGPLDAILLPAGTLPETSGWLARWRRRLASATSPCLLTARPLAAPSGASSPVTPSASICVGFNRLAAAALMASPLRTTSLRGDLACLARTLGPGAVTVDRRTGIGLIAGRAPADAALDAAEARIAEGLASIAGARAP